MEEKFNAPTLNRWRANFVLQGVSVARADECWRFVVRDGIWISKYSPRQALEYYLNITRDEDKLSDVSLDPCPLDPRQEKLWRTRRRREQAEREYAAAMADPAIRAEIDEIRNRVLHKVAHLSLGQ